MSKKLGVREVKKHLRRISNEVGYEYTYEAPYFENEYGELEQGSECYYTDPEGKPSCIVGALLERVAPSALRSLHRYEWDNPYSPEVIAAHELVGAAVVDLGTWFTPEAVTMLIKAQKLQDGGCSWGETVDALDKQY